MDTVIPHAKQKRSSHVSGIVLAVVDTGPLYAVVDADDQDHQVCLAALEMPGLSLFVPAMVVAEATYLVGKRLGPMIEAEFLNGLSDLSVIAPTSDDWRYISELVKQYRDFPLGGTDASVIALAERLDTDVIITLDRRHFTAVRPRYAAAWRLLPD